ncbi:MAG: hypothetical protein D6800_06180 [Candidatus Zixiibacteriota bacterium]|nr:MAG: hypothetical protein D6800_06180 [candidate division Zixibacteria bacterium]
MMPMKPRGRQLLSRVLGGTLTVSILLTISAPTSTFSDSASREPVPLVIVNNDTISSRDLDRELIRFHKRISTTEKLDFNYRKLLKKLVNDRLIIQEATALGLDREPDLIARLDSIRTRKAAELFVKTHYAPDLSVSDNEVREYFNTYYARLQLRTVTVADKPDAQDIVRRIRAGEDMDSIARAVSLDTYRYLGGLHKNKYYGDVERALRDPSDTLATGAVSAPIPFRGVWTVLRVERRTPADTIELPEHRRYIEGVLKYQKNERFWNAFIDSLRAIFPVTTDTAALAFVVADSQNLFTQTFTSGSDRVVMRTADGQRVTDRQFRHRLSHLAMSMGTAPFDSILTVTLEKLTEQLVLTAAARREGYLNLPEVSQTYAHSRDSALIEAYLDETVVPQIRFRHDEFEAYYQAHLDDFRLPSSCQFDRLVVDSAAKAKEIARRLASGADFYYTGRQYGAKLSTPQEAAEWVDLQTFPDTIRQEIEHLNIGQTTAPHLTTEGWLILRLKARRPGTPQPLQDVEMQIRQVMFNKKFTEALDKTLAILKKNSQIEYRQQAIDAYFGTAKQGQP